MSNDEARKRVGILYPGEMGTAVGERLLELGVDVITTCDGRGPRTRDRCKQAGFTVVSSLEEVVEASSLVVSLVPPAEAFRLAERVAAKLTSGRPVIYVDANSTSPETAQKIDELMTAHGGAFVDAAIHGQAGRLREMGTLYLSGPEAPAVAKQLDGIAARIVVSPRVGSASMMKMVMGGMSKGLVALFLEIATVAHAAGLKEEFLAGCEQYYPGVMTALRRLLPTVPEHSERRGQEMGELEETIRSLELRPGFAAEARRMFAALGKSDLAPDAGATEISDLIDLIARHGPLSPGNSE